MISLVQKYTNAASFLAQLSTTSNGSELFCSGGGLAALSERVHLDVRIVEGPCVALQGTVRWHRPGKARAALASANNGTSPGISVLLDSSEAPKVDFLRAYSLQAMSDRRRGEQRHVVSHQVLCIAGVVSRLSLTRDISPSGLVLYCRERPVVGTHLRLVMTPLDGLSAWHLEGTVVRHIDDDVNSAVAIALQFPSSERRLAFYRHFGPR